MSGSKVRPLGESYLPRDLLPPRSQNGLNIILLLAALSSCGLLHAQSSGEADVAFQGYNLSGNGETVFNTTGLAVNTKEFVPGLGLFVGNFEGYGGSGFHTGDNYVGLQGAPIAGWHWDFTGGDFHFDSHMVDNPFPNVYTPDLAARGFRVVMRRKNRSFQFFAGEETLLGGPRIPFRLSMPQQMLGASMQQKVGKRWEFGLRFLNLSSDASSLNSQPEFFFTGHDFRSANSLTFQSSYHATKHLKFYVEAGYGKASSFDPTPVNQKPFSLLAGPTYETHKITLRGYYVRQSTTYMPLLGYFVGDRRGPLAEGRYRLTRRVEIFGSASSYSNNLERNQTLPTFRSNAGSLGTSLDLPWRFNASGTYSKIHFTARDPSRPNDSISDNRQAMLNLYRPIRRHSLRWTLIDMKLNANTQPQKQRFFEFEDRYTWKRFVIGGAVRSQETRSTEDRNSLFFRGSFQANFKRVSAYGYFEKGNDLVNRSIFSTNSYSSTVAGLSTPFVRGWNLQMEAFRNNLLTDLNPENIFLFGSGGQGLNTRLSAFNQWSVFFRISKHFRWGKELPGGTNFEDYAAEHAPLVGSVQGLVIEQSISGPRPVSNVPVSLDHDRSAMTDSSGRYEFSNVPEGPHEVGLDMEQLPTDYEPGAGSSARVMVDPGALLRSDFTVARLTIIEGQVIAPAGAPIQNVLVRLAKTNRYTTPEMDGNFGFYNLREGEYDVDMDIPTIPEGFMLASPAHVHVMASRAQPAPRVIFELQPKPPEEKPVRQIFQEPIHIGGSAGGGQGRR
jgi:hypothetical protein